MSDYKSQIKVLEKDILSIAEKLNDSKIPPSRKIPLAKQLKSKKDEIKVIQDKIEVEKYNSIASKEKGKSE